MAFGIGTNTSTPNAGEVKGSQWEVACDCWFTADGDLLPRYIKVKDEDGEIRTIKQLQIHSQERKNYAVDLIDATEILLHQRQIPRLMNSHNTSLNVRVTL